MANIDQQRFSTVVGVSGASTGSGIVHLCSDPVLSQGPPERFWSPELPSGEIFNVLPSGLSG